MNKYVRRRILVGALAFVILLTGVVGYANKGMIRAAIEQLQGND